MVANFYNFVTIMLSKAMSMHWWCWYPIIQKSKQYTMSQSLFQALSWDFPMCAINHMHKFQIWGSRCKIWKLWQNYFHFSYVFTIFKTINQPLHTFIHVSGNIIDYDIYFKALIHCLELQKGTVLFSH